MNIVFLGSLFSKDREKEIFSSTIGSFVNANNALQYALIEGFSLNNEEYDVDLSIMNMPNIGAYPFKYNKIYFRSSSFDLFCYKGVNISFLNMPLIKHYIKYKNIKYELTKYLKTNSKDVFFIVYDLYEPYLRALVELKIKYTSVKICVIVPDLLGFTGLPKNWIYNKWVDIEERKVNACLLNVDAYILICEGMKDVLPLYNKPYIVLEGIYYNEISDKNNIVNNSEIKTIFYSGLINERYGILVLLEAFSKIDQPNYRLVICGEGTARNAVVYASQKDNRIIYKGQLPRKDVLELQKEATLLVNPRQPVEEYTKYSFPSKIMEYYASGTPVLMYKLLGIPEEYYQYCYCLEEITVEYFTKRMIEICNLHESILKQKGIDAKEFILKNKNSKKQVSRILNFISSI